MRILRFRRSDELFTNAVPIRDKLSDGKPHRPKSDFWFGLGLYNDEQLSRLKGLELSERAIDYFTQNNLTTLNTDHDNNFHYQPSKSNKGAGFPWMVVELKKEFGNERECLRQAANGCHTALCLYERLVFPKTKDVTPIVALTSIGPEAKLFISYKDRKDRCYVCLL